MTTKKKSSNCLEYIISFQWRDEGTDEYFQHSRAIEKLFPRSFNGSGMGACGSDVSLHCKKINTVNKIVTGLIQYANKHNLLYVDITITITENE
jgi:hypothetical protein